MKLVKLKCESCGAMLKVNEDLKKVCCNYCGAEFLIDDGSTTHTYRKIDEARIKESEIKDKINARELEYKEREEKRNNLSIFICFALMILMVFFCLGMSFYYEQKSMPNENEIKIPVDVKTFKGEDYQQVIQELEDIGFENVESITIKDLVTGWITRDGEVEKVSINGDTEFEEGDIFPKNATVVVTYHTFKEK